MTLTVDLAPSAGPVTRVESALRHGHAPAQDDLRALVTAARETARLEEQCATLLTRLARVNRTGQLLAQCRAERQDLQSTLADVEELAARHRRGDPYGVQGAAAQEILDVIAASPTAHHSNQAGATPSVGAAFS